MAVGVALRDFCENTSVHGLAFVVESKSSILKRLAWMTIFLMCLSYAIMQIKESIDGRLRTVNDRKYVSHFRPKPKLKPEKHLALGRIPKPKPNVQKFVKMGGFCCSLTFLMSSVNIFFYNFGNSFKLIIEITFVFKCISVV